MEISADEINLLSKRISNSTVDYTVSGVYSIENGLLLRLRHSTKPEKLIAIASFSMWLTTKNLALPEATPFVTRIRDYIERERIVSAEQVGNERISRIKFEGRTGEAHHLYAEFFAGGNQIVTNADDSDTILDAARQQTFRHRSVTRGAQYVLPPSRGVPLFDVTQESLKKFIAREKDLQIEAIKWFGRNVGTSRKFVEEIFSRSSVDPTITAQSLSEDNLTALSHAASSLLSDLEKSDQGFLLLPNEEQATKRDLAEKIDVDVCAIIPKRWEELQASQLASIVTFPALSDAFDEAQVESLKSERRRKASLEIRSKLAELESAISKQDQLLEQNKKSALTLRSLSQDIMNGGRSEISEELVRELFDLGILDQDAHSGGAMRFTSEPRTFLSSLGIRALASRLFDEAKRLEEGNRRIASIRGALLSQIEQLQQQSTLQEERVERKLNVERRAREWFERYRWFIASDGSLVIGGRDGTTNSVIVNRYTHADDFVFHADLHGSPFFVLKSRKEDLGEEMALELGQATVSFSSAWKNELGSADAYWVKAQQVKKSAPTGEYLPRGSFFIEGKKNFVKHIRTELSIGIMTSSKLPKNIDPESMQTSDEPGKSSEESVLIVCGPEKSISAYTIAHVQIAPGREKASQIAKRIKQILVGKVKEPALKDMSKRITIDEVIRALPSGGYKIVSEKQNR